MAAEINTPHLIKCNFIYHPQGQKAIFLKTILIVYTLLPRSTAGQKRKKTVCVKRRWPCWQFISSLSSEYRVALRYSAATDEELSLRVCAQKRR